MYAMRNSGRTFVMASASSRGLNDTPATLYEERIFTLSAGASISSMVARIASGM
ncbi:hypothetical protein D3C83_242380 [compost metagenome]